MERINKPATPPQTDRQLTPQEFMDNLLHLEPLEAMGWSAPVKSKNWSEPRTLEDLAGPISPIKPQVK